MANLDKHSLPKWRYFIREALLPVVRWETPYIAYLQERLRSPALDSYFAMTANLGTHTAFMVTLPILFWCGYMSLARGMLHILAMGVYLSGFVKDLLCLPRPLSPPLTRITMSGSAALEYGFPSTHSTNAVSVVYYALHVLKHQQNTLAPMVMSSIQFLLYIYMTSIILGRVYCGMHGFFDVIVGSALGALIGAVQCHFGPDFDAWLYSTSLRGVVAAILILLVSVRIHPEPADDCPCFDDSVAFEGVMIGCEIACWRFSRSPFAWTSPPNVPFDLKQVGLLIAILRILLGVLVIFAWRATMKPLLLKILPPIFRVIELLGLDSPRRFFVKASQYTSVPKQRNDDNVIPSARDIPIFLSNLRQRKRAISIGPQSEADAYETLAYREKHRRDSLSSSRPITPIQEAASPNGYFEPSDTANPLPPNKIRRRAQSIEEFRRQMGSGTGTDTLSPDVSATPGIGEQPPLLAAKTEENIQQALLFARVQRPRVRYDVEVVTKLIVYTGIAWLAIEGNPVLFHYIGWSPLSWMAQ